VRGFSGASRSRPRRPLEPFGYELELMGDLTTAGPDKALFKRIYSSWRPT